MKCHLLKIYQKIIFQFKWKIYIILNINKNELGSNFEIFILCIFKITALEFELEFLKGKKMYIMCNKKFLMLFFNIFGSTISICHIKYYDRKEYIFQRENSL